jgi:hypothetical protein
MSVLLGGEFGGGGEDFGVGVDVGFGGGGGDEGHIVEGGEEDAAVEGVTGGGSARETGLSSSMEVLIDFSLARGLLCPPRKDQRPHSDIAPPVRGRASQEETK